MWSRSWPAAAAAFGLPGWAARLLPWVELGLGGVIVARIGLPWTALAAAALLAGFTVAVGVRIARGDAVPCGCFGSVSARPVSWATVARNVGFMALALAAAVAR